MDEKPLHVQVAEALGWAEPSFSPPRNSMNLADKGMWFGYRAPAVIGQKIPIPHYDTDWSATGPLIEKYGITVGRFRPDFCGGSAYAVLPGQDSPEAIAEAHGATILIAVCNLLLLAHSRPSRAS